MSVVVCTFQGRTGNACMQYLFARAAAEQLGAELQTDPWIGERIFQISHPRPEPRERHRFNETDAQQVNAFSLLLNRRVKEIEFRGYAQCQGAMIYTKRQAQSWLRLRPEIETACANAVLADGGKDDRVVCHRRVGDYIGYSYPVVSIRSYTKACERFGLRSEPPHIAMLTEENPTPHDGFLPDDLGFMADFYRMMVAPTLLRGNSSFSFLAALLGDGLVLSPIVDGLEGGKEHDTVFVAGNHPKFAPHLDFVTDLFVSP